MAPLHPNLTCAHCVALRARHPAATCLGCAVSAVAALRAATAPTRRLNELAMGAPPADVVFGTVATRTVGSQEQPLLALRPAWREGGRWLLLDCPCGCGARVKLAVANPPGGQQPVRAAAHWTVQGSADTAWGISLAERVVVPGHWRGVVRRGRARPQ